jgi:serine/threonine protein phosphatase PrpC
VKNFAGVEGLYFFGVCDGHGVNGHHVSDFVKKNLPKILS